MQNMQCPIYNGTLKTFCIFVCKLIETSLYSNSNSGVRYIQSTELNTQIFRLWFLPDYLNFYFAKPWYEYFYEVFLAKFYINLNKNLYVAFLKIKPLTYSVI